MGSVVEAGRLGNAVFPGRSSRRIAYDLAVPHLNPAGGRNPRKPAIPEEKYIFVHINSR